MHVMVVTATTITAPGSLPASGAAAINPQQHSRVGIAKAIHQISITSPVRRRCVSVIVVVAADVNPLRPVRGPHSTPAAVVGGVSQRRADERRTLESVMDHAA